jgi:hypothetical protein
MIKRLLRFAMSKLNIFDEATLDLDNLDLAFGRNNTFEFRDVGIITKVRLCWPELRLRACPTCLAEELTETATET